MTTCPRALAITCTLALAACPNGCEPVDPVDDAGVHTLHGMKACTDAALREGPCRTYRAITGASMGGGAALRIGFDSAPLFDTVAALSTPFADLEVFWAILLENHLAGFCTREALEAVLDDDPAALDDPTRAFCGVHDVVPTSTTAPFSAVDPDYLVVAPETACASFRSSFDHFYRGTEAGRGAAFEREYVLRVFDDLVRVYGNPFFANDDDTYTAPGVSADFALAPDPAIELAPAPFVDDGKARCADVARVTGLRSRAHNVDGAYPVIAVCDGGKPFSGEAVSADDDEADRWPMPYLLAVDMNDNGRRDRGEPIVLHHREPFDDTGADGVPSSSESGYDAALNPDPAGDDWHPLTNPLGTEMNRRRDEGEPFDDDGLDGVSATEDFGEGNGVYDVSPGYARMVERSPPTLWNALDDAQRARLHVWLDAGIRDFLNSAAITNNLFGALASHVDDARTFDGFGALPRAFEGPYSYHRVDFSEDAMGRVSYLRYGDPSICPSSDVETGDGNHVGPDIIERLYAMYSFVSARFPADDRQESLGGDIGDLGSPTGALQDFAFLDRFDSAVLGREQEFGVLLPPDYFVDEDRRYPTVYFLHGQGNSARELVGMGIILFELMKASPAPERAEAGLADLQRMIFVFPDAQCRAGECWTGNFFADFEGTPRDDLQFEQALFELMRVVEGRYRTLSAE